jgi:hypothetical protein
MDDENHEILIYLVCYSLDSRFRLLIRLVEVLLEYGLAAHAAWESLGLSTLLV